MYVKKSKRINRRGIHRHRRWVFVVYFYCDEARTLANASVQEIDPDDTNTWGAVGSGWQVGPAFPDRESAQRRADEYKVEMARQGYGIGSYTNATF